MSPQVWSHYEETPVEEVVPVLEEKERTANYKPVFVTEITDDLHFYVQDVETGTGGHLGTPSTRGAPQARRGGASWICGMRIWAWRVRPKSMSKVTWGHPSTPQGYFWDQGRGP